MLVHGIGKRAKFWNWEWEKDNAVEGTLSGYDGSHYDINKPWMCEHGWFQHYELLEPADPLIDRLAAIQHQLERIAKLLEKRCT